MPKAIKKRVAKKPGLKEEEVKSRAFETITLLKEKKKVLIYGLSALALAAILAIVFILYSSSLKKKAYDYERDAYNYYYNINLKNPMTEEERWKKALELFQKAVEVKSTPSAQFYTGNCYFNLGDYENAIKAYNEFIDKYKNNEQILPLVYQKLALTYIKNGRGDEAIRTLNTLAQFKKGIFKDSALRIEAWYYETTGKHEEAVKKYQELVRDFPLSPWSAEAKARVEIEKGGESEISQTK
jgi:tetratricopeptide (TPR) repeat protein